MPRVEFSSDGIRGVVGEWPFVKPAMMRIGQALGEYVRARSDDPTVVIGCDTRPSGIGLVSCLAAGMMDQGADVVNLGVMTTPGVAFITRRNEADLGVIVSASHSPYEYNGIKLVDRYGLRLQREDEVDIEALIDKCLSRSPDPAEVQGQETVVPNLIEFYIRDHVARFPSQSLAGLSVVLDCAQGATAEVAPEVFRRLGARVKAINNAAEGENINHLCGSEHVRKCPEELVECMKQHGAGYGYAFDGDGDRLVVVDDTGRVYDGHDLLFVLARYYHDQGLLRHNAVVTAHHSNRGFEESLCRFGIRTVYTDNGDKNLEAEMWGGGYLLGSEIGGNIIINDGYHSAADAIYASLILSRMLVQKRPTTLRELIVPFQRYPQERISIDLHGHVLTDGQRECIERERQQKEHELGEGSKIVIRDATTEPGVVRIMVEGNLGNTPDQVRAAANSIGQRLGQLVL